MSRLDRLVLLLDTGSLAFIRTTAADQLAALAKAHPDEILNIIARVYPYLKSKKWDTRIAAAKAFGGIVLAAPVWDPNEIIPKSDDTTSSNDDECIKKEEETKQITDKDGDVSINQNENIAVKMENDEISKFQSIVKKEAADSNDIQLKVEAADSDSIKQEIKDEIDDSEKLRRIDELMNGLDNISLNQLNFGLLLKLCPTLLAEGDSVFHFDENKDLAENLRLNRQILNARLGHGDPSILIQQEQEYKKAKLLKEQEQNRLKKAKEAELDAKRKAAAEENNDGSNPSLPPSKALNARLRAMARRRAKVTVTTLQTQKSPIDLSQSSLSAHDDMEPKVIKSEPTKFEITSQTDANVLVIESKVCNIAFDQGTLSKVWQFQGLYELLLFDLFNPNWEIRHGSALGLKELVLTHAKSVNKLGGLSKEDNARRNLEALEDLVVKILSLFALDRFGDYIGDSVVAPVRESTSQTLAVLLNSIDETNPIERDFLDRIINKLIELLIQDPNVFRLPQEKYTRSFCWEAAHGAVLGLKYIVSIKKDFIFRDEKVFHKVISVVLDGLQNHVEEIQSESAALLIPIISHILPYKEWLIKILKTIWGILESIHDDLKSSLNNILVLVSTLSNYPEVLTLMDEMSAADSESSAKDYYSFENLVPKLYAFSRHSISKIRRSVLETFLSFLNVKIENIDPQKKYWFQDYLLLRLIFQNLLFEQNESILKISFEVFKKIILKNIECFGSLTTLLQGQQLQSLLNLILIPLGVYRLNYSMEYENIVKANGDTFGNNHINNNSNSTNKDFEISGSSTSEEAPAKRGRKRKTPTQGIDAQDLTHGFNSETLEVNIDAPMIKGDIALLGMDVFIRTRLTAAKAFGFLFASIETSKHPSIESIFDRLISGLNSKFSSPRIFSSIVIETYFDRLSELKIKPMNSKIEIIQDTIMKYLSDSDSNLPFYRELTQTLKTLRSSCSELFLRFEEIGGVAHSKIPILPVVVQGEKEAGISAFSITDAEKVVNYHFNKLSKYLSGVSAYTASEALEKSKQSIINKIDDLNELRDSRNISVLASYASAGLKIHLNKGNIPPKLNPFIRCLMDSIKSDSLLYQQNTAASVTQLIIKLVELEKSKVFEKIIKNLCSYLCVQFPEFNATKDANETIFSLEIQKSIAKLNNYEGSNSPKVIGAKTTLFMIIDYYKNDIFNKLPILQELSFEPSKKLKDANAEISQEIIDSLGIIETISGELNDSNLLYENNLDEFALLNGLKSKYSILRYSISKVFAKLCKNYPHKAIPFLVMNVLPLLKNSGFLHHRQGAIETVYHLSNTMGADILPYVIFFIVPVLGRMSDSDPGIRVLATTTFASIIKLVPLESGIEDPSDMPAELLEGKEKERSFIKELMNPKEIPDYDLPVAIKATLRSYQKAGVNWLHFLNKYNLHGILCDDMGLGKTLQTICIISSDHHNRMDQYEKTKLDEFKKLPSIVVSPASVMGHWEEEINKYAPFLKVSIYSGSPSSRIPLRSLFDVSDIIVTSYDVMRNDVEFISSKSFNYAVLDEGHIIKNASSKLSKSVKCVKAEHRLILTGTPIQNNVLELWSLFDFLMPGFLGTEKFFQEKFSKPIAASRNSKTSTKEQERGALALEALHKQVLPFMLRRLKSEVLNDLPPKIIQDRYCDLSVIQKAMYKDFVKKQKSSVEEDLKQAATGSEEASDNSSSSNGQRHVFQALQYMRKLCNHPSLVLTPEHPNFEQVQQYLKDSNSDIEDIRHSPKLMDLKNLLFECGIATASKLNFISSKKTQKAEKLEQEELLTDGVISQHRALIFCQLKEMLDKVEEDLLKKYLPGVTYMRLDGSTDPRERQKLVSTFNSDPSIDLLLLTTRVGGLGLNLTGADTVIFVEHDWNPMNDLQAMDRVHRLGQTKVVNVFRLITRNTLEEKIMALQNFKVDVASAVVSQQNNNLNNMNTDQLLDLFDVDDKEDAEGVSNLNGEGRANGENGNGSSGGASGGDKAENDIDDLGLGNKAKKALGALSEMWDNTQYEEEYNVNTFMDNLKNRK